MRTNAIDWRLVVGLIFLFFILFSRSPQTDFIMLALGAGWFLQTGLTPWRGRGSVLGSTKVTYWRGERIVTRQPPRARFRSVGGMQLLVSVWYVVLGLSMVYAAILLFARLVS